MTCVAILTGCDIATPTEGSKCDSALLWLRLSKLDHMRCFVDKHARKAWIRETNIKLSEARKARAISFNERLSILEPRGFEKEEFVTVSSVDDVPEVWGLSEKNSKYLGKRYQGNARISWSGYESSDTTIIVHDLSERKKGGSTVHRTAETHFLNDYQRQFLAKHCQFTSSLCEGQVFLAIERSAEWPFYATLEFVGALLHKAEGSLVIDSCLDYAAQVVELDGEVIKQTFAGPPNYKSIEQGDTPETFWILHLVKPLCVNKGTDRMDEVESNVRKVQLLLDDDMYNRFRDLVGRRVSVKGKLSHSFTIHHREKVLLVVSELSLASSDTALMPTDIGETEPRVNWKDWLKQQFQNAAGLIGRLTQLDYTPEPED
jgi:hypothetical protein